MEPDLGKYNWVGPEQKGALHLLKLEKGNEGWAGRSVCRSTGGKILRELVLSCLCSRITY